HQPTVTSKKYPRYYSSHLLYKLFFLIIPPPPRSTLFPYTTLFRSRADRRSCDAPAPSIRRASTARSSRRASATPRLAGCSTGRTDRKSTRLNSSHSQISYAVFCLKKKRKNSTLGCNVL